jgi:hypothetical protein
MEPPSIHRLLAWAKTPGFDGSSRSPEPSITIEGELASLPEAVAATGAIEPAEGAGSSAGAAPTRESAIKVAQDRMRASRRNP